MLAIIVFAFMITCMSYLILLCLILSYSVLFSSISGDPNVGNNCVCIHDNLDTLSYLNLSHRPVFQVVVRMLAIIVFVS